MYMRTFFYSAVVSFIFSLTVFPGDGDAQAADADSIERGRYLVIISGCNDCHTPGYAPSNGQTDESLWLTGDITGINLDMTQAQ